MNGREQNPGENDNGLKRRAVRGGHGAIGDDAGVRSGTAGTNKKTPSGSRSSA
uniref:hypothetical protein n=1 Tax=Paenibacillus allorhizosphaerae TaxID=2849866 RepID=UPI001C4027D6|nr:hypothetical protein [Paenibacillus allorhizosphaerae]